MSTYWYTFSQNNSGGSFAKPALHITVEAHSAEEANERVLQVEGVYFDGVESGEDCYCCGDRWYPEFGEHSRQEFPHVYGQRVSEDSSPKDEFYKACAEEAGKYVLILPLGVT